MLNKATNRISMVSLLSQARRRHLKPSVLLIAAMFLLMTLTLTGGSDHGSQLELSHQNNPPLHLSTSAFSLTASTTDKAKQTTTGVTTTNGSPVSPIDPRPITGLSAINDSPTLLGTPTNFTATVVTGSNVSYTWAFGLEYADSTSTGRIVSYTYPAVGVYTAIVTAENSINHIITTTTATVTTPPEFGAFEPSSWVTLTRRPVCSIEVRDSVTGLDTNSARFRWSSSGYEHLLRQPWLTATVSGADETTEWQMISATVPFTQDSSSDNLVQFAIANTAGFSSTSQVRAVKIDTMPPGPWRGFSRVPDGDTTELEAGQPVTYSITVSDTTSGLDCNQASYQSWTGDDWSEWNPTICNRVMSPTIAQLVATPSIGYLSHTASLCDNQNKVRFRIRDRAGHSSSTLRQEEYCIYLPILMRCFPHYDLPRNGDFAASDSETDFAADWLEESKHPPLVVEHTDIDTDTEQSIFMGYDKNERFDLPGVGECAVARLYQDFDLPEFGPSSCYSPTIKFSYKLSSYDYNRYPENGGDAFLVYIEDRDNESQHLIHQDQSEQPSGGDLYEGDWNTPVITLPTSIGGGPVRLRFEVRHCEPWPRKKAWWPTWVYLDYVIIQKR